MSLSGTTCTRDTSPLASISLTKSFQDIFPPLVLMELSKLMMTAIINSVRSLSLYIWSSCSRLFFSSRKERYWCLSINILMGFNLLHVSLKQSTMDECFMASTKLFVPSNELQKVCLFMSLKSFCNFLLRYINLNLVSRHYNYKVFSFVKLSFMWLYETTVLCVLVLITQYFFCHLKRILLKSTKYLHPPLEFSLFLHLSFHVFCWMCWNNVSHLSDVKKKTFVTVLLNYNHHWDVQLSRNVKTY